MSLLGTTQATVSNMQKGYDIVSKRAVSLDPTRHLLHIENVTKVYHGKEGPKTVLDNVDLQVTKGEFIALVGPSGCGKSTLLRLILGSEEPTSGTLCIDGVPAGHPDPSRGIVYQQYSLFPHLSVLENVLLGKRLSLPFFEWYKQKAELTALATEYLKTAHLDDHLHKYPSQLSGGQRQRAAVLQALMMDPKILLMDEPFGALDPGTRERMQTFTLEGWEETGKTIFLVTHDLEEAAFMATRVIVLSQYYTDDRTGMTVRGARIKGDFKTGEIGRAQSTDWKRSKEFGDLVQDIREMGFNPNHQHHVNEFNLKHPDSFHTVSEEEVNGTKK